MSENFSKQFGKMLADTVLKMAPKMMEDLINAFPFGKLLTVGGKFGLELMSNLSNETREALHPDMSVDELNQVYVFPIDCIIIKTERDTGDKFIGGEFLVSYYDEDSFKCAFDLYFQNSQGIWMKKSASSNPINNNFLSSNAIKEIAEQKKIKFQIEPPKKSKEEIQDEIANKLAEAFEQNSMSESILSEKPINLNK